MIVRLFTGDDGKSHLEELLIPVEEVESLPLRGEANITFRRAATAVSATGTMPPGANSSSLSQAGPRSVSATVQ